jgi:hypothetical protein
MESAIPNMVLPKLKELNLAGFARGLELAEN